MVTTESEFPPALRGVMRLDEPMAGHNSWKAGGSADRFYLPADLDDLQTFLRGLPISEPLLWLGLGSNVLIRDGGIRGTVICTLNRLKQMDLQGQTGLLRVGAGVPCAHVARYTAERGLVGAEFLAGIPGTMGGALAMNAGAFAGETWQIVAEVTTIDRTGALHRRSPDSFNIGYRRVSGLDQEWFVSCTLALASGDVDAARQRIRSLLARRLETQPIQLPSCGSVFWNPPGDHAARLIEAAGLKGYQRGAAQVSEKHANFIVNLGGARAADIEALILHVQHEVKRIHGVELTPEVRIVGSNS